MTQRIASLGAMAVLVCMALFLVVSPAHANPLYLGPSAQTATATTSPVFMTPGNATSTLAFDSYTGGGNQTADYGTLLIQTVASSTSSVYTVEFQFSYDGIDWFQNNLLATATTSTNVSNANTYTFTAGTTTPERRAITIPTPLRYVRSIVSILGANGSLWQQIVPSRQTPE